MRYAKAESVYILGVFNTGDIVTIDIYRLSDDQQLINSDSCTEIGSTGVFKYQFTSGATQKEEYLWIMNNGEYSKYGKIVFGGYMDHIKEIVGEHRNVVEPKIDTNISSRASQSSVDAIPHNPLLDSDPRLDNLDVPISSRSSHTPEDVWTYENRELSNPDNYKSDSSELIDKLEKHDKKIYNKLISG